MQQLVNFELLAQPYNWVTVILILLIGAMALHLLLSVPGAPQDQTLSF